VSFNAINFRVKGNLTYRNTLFALIMPSTIKISWSNSTLITTCNARYYYAKRPKKITLLTAGLLTLFIPAYFWVGYPDTAW